VLEDFSFLGDIVYQCVIGGPERGEDVVLSSLSCFGEVPYILGVGLVLSQLGSAQLLLSSGLLDQIGTSCCELLEQPLSSNSQPNWDIFTFLGAYHMPWRCRRPFNPLTLWAAHLSELMLCRGHASPCLTEPTCVYDRNRKKTVSTKGGLNVEDPASFFANVFSSERFMAMCAPLAFLLFSHIHIRG